MCSAWTKLLLVALSLGAQSAAIAAPIVYTFAGEGSGSVGSTSFVDAPFEITVTSDTLDVFTTQPPLPAGVLIAPPTGHSIEIAGLAPNTFATPFAVGLNTSAPGVTLTDVDDALAPTTAFDMFGLLDEAFAGFDLVSNFGPLVEMHPVGVDQFVAVPTVAGPLTFSSIESITFTATLVPEAASLPLLLAGLAGAATRRRADSRALDSVAWRR